MLCNSWMAFSVQFSVEGEEVLVLNGRSRICLHSHSSFDVVFVFPCNGPRLVCPPAFLFFLFLVLLEIGIFVGLDFSGGCVIVFSRALASSCFGAVGTHVLFTRVWHASRAMVCFLLSAFGRCRIKESHFRLACNPFHVIGRIWRGSGLYVTTRCRCSQVWGYC